MRRLIALLALSAAAPAALIAQTAPAPVAAEAYDPAVAKQAIGALADELERSFVFPDAARAYAAMLRGNLTKGSYDGFTDADTLTRQVTDDLQAVAPDGHLRMRGPGPSGPRPRRDGSMPEPFEQAGWIAPSIAYIRFNVFMGGQEATDFAAFLDQYQGAATLIIDARTHHGGGLDEMDQLFPRIFAKPQTVMVMDTRGDIAEDAEVLESSPTLVQVEAPGDIRRSEHRVIPGAASPWRKAKIFYLTSGRTASAAEHLASVLKYTGRATLIGDTTAGAGNYGRGVELPGGYAAFVPVGHSYFPGTKGWEGTGVEPDVAVAPEQALTEALVRAGVPRAKAETLSASHVPGEPMTRRHPLRS